MMAEALARHFEANVEECERAEKRYEMVATEK
jgi:hypothetical protein